MMVRVADEAVRRLGAASERMLSSAREGRGRLESRSAPDGVPSSRSFCTAKYFWQRQREGLSQEKDRSAIKLNQRTSRH